MHPTFKEHLPSYYDEANDLYVVEGRPIDMMDYDGADLAHMLRAGGDACEAAGLCWSDVIEYAAIELLLLIEE